MSAAAESTPCGLSTAAELSWVSVESSSSTRIGSKLGMAELGGNPGVSGSAAVVAAPVDLGAETYTNHMTRSTVIAYNLSDSAIVRV